LYLDLSTNKSRLACKVIKLHENGLCALQIQYSTLESGVHYTELENIPLRNVTLHKAASAQSLVNLTKLDVVVRPVVQQLDVLVAKL